MNEEGSSCGDDNKRKRDNDSDDDLAVVSVDPVNSVDPVDSVDPIVYWTQFQAEIAAIQIVTASWLGEIEDNKYLAALRQEIENLALKATMTVSMVDQVVLMTAATAAGPETTMTDNTELEKQLISLLDEYNDLKPIAENATKPHTKVLTRHASDEN